MRILILLGALLVSYLLLVVYTWIVQWGLEQILEAAGVTADMPFWPIFLILFVISALIAGGSLSNN